MAHDPSGQLSEGNVSTVEEYEKKINENGYSKGVSHLDVVDGQLEIVERDPHKYWDDKNVGSGSIEKIKSTSPEGAGDLKDDVTLN